MLYEVITGIDDGIGIRQCLGRGMMIGDDQIDAARFTDIGGLHSRDAVIHRKDDISLDTLENFG